MGLSSASMFGKIYILLLILLLGTLSAPTLAETVYVNDTLHVGVRDAPGSSGEPRAVVVTGMRLQVLARDGAYIRIRSDKGVEGWIKSAYVTPDKPAVLQLADLQSAQKQLKAKLATQQQTIEQDTARTTALSQELLKLRQENTRMRKRLGETRDIQKKRQYVYLGLGAALLLLAVGGFTAGALWHRKRAMRRLGGLRI